jgi:hypothetical protein
MVVLGTTGYYVRPVQAEGRPGHGVNEAAEKGGKVIQYLDKNHPNPFNPSTHIVFGLNRGSQVSLGIYSAEGELVRRLYEGPMEPGDHNFLWDGRTGDGAGVASGIYFYRLWAGTELATGRMVMLK